MRKKKKQKAILDRLSLRILEPPKRLTVSEWAVQHRKLSSENSAESGSYRLERTPYIKEPADAFNDPLVEQITIMKSAQTGFTTMIENIVGYIVTEDPCPVLALLPTLDAAESFSKDRIALMARDTRCLRDLLADDKTRKSSSTILQKTFPGGRISFAGSNSPTSLASRAIRVLLCDEVDRMAVSAGNEGNPITLAIARTKTFAANRKIVMVSTPTISGLSRIQKEFEASDQNYYWVPCPSCDNYQVLKWGNRGGPFGMQWEEGNPDSAYYQCAHCPYHILETDKPRFNLRGEWRPSAPFRGNRGYHISELYSPFVTFAEMAKTYTDTGKLPEKLKAFVNLSLGEPWEEANTPEIQTDTMLSRVEAYTQSSLPDEVVVVVAGVDVQGDRLEVEAVGYGRNWESWGVAKHTFYGQTSQPEVWNDLDEFLKSEFETVSGRRLRIAATMIDSGYNTQTVYDFVKPRFNRRIFASKGIAGMGRPLIGRPSTANASNVRLFPIGVDTGKEIVIASLKVTEPGPSYAHFPNQTGYDLEYFEQLTSEKKITKYKNGYPYQVWHKVRDRNEALDIRVYARAALESLDIRDMNKLADKVTRDPNAEPGAGSTETQAPVPNPVSPFVPRTNKVPQSPYRPGGSWTKWRG